MGGVEVERRGDDYALHVAVLQQTAVVVVKFGLGIVLRRVLQMGAVVVAQGDHLDGGHLQQMFYVEYTARAGAYYSYARLLAAHLAFRFVAARLQPRKER